MPLSAGNGRPLMTCPEFAGGRFTTFTGLPGVIVTVLLYISVLVPAIEEIFKPIGVWLFARRLQSAAQGFALGALSGAGYALIETIGVSGQQTGEWASLLFSRIGTGLLHITTSALVGAAIVLLIAFGTFVGLGGSPAKALVMLAAGLVRPTPVAAQTVERDLMEFVAAQGTFDFFGIQFVEITGIVQCGCCIPRQPPPEVVPPATPAPKTPASGT